LEGWEVRLRGVARDLTLIAIGGVIRLRFREVYFSFQRIFCATTQRTENKKGRGTAEMAPKLSEDEIDDLLYFARVGDKAEFNTLKDELCKRENLSDEQLVEVARDEESGNGVLHMAAANGHSGTRSLPLPFCRTKSSMLLTFAHRTPPRTLQISLRSYWTTKPNDASDLEYTE
jgi:hypothetical protein